MSFSRLASVVFRSSVSAFQTALVVGAVLVVQALGIVPGAQAQVPLPEAGALHGSLSAALGQDVIVSVSEINELAVSATTTTISVSGVVPGGPSANETDATTTYGITTNGASKKITAALSALYSTGIDLAVELAAPSGATSTARTLGTAALDVVTNLTRVAEGTLTVTYTATVASNVPPNGAGETRTVTFTLTDS